MRVGGLLSGVMAVLAVAGCGSSQPAAQVVTEQSATDRVHRSMPELAQAITTATHLKRYATIEMPSEGGKTAGALYAEAPDGATSVAMTAGMSGKEIHIVWTGGVLYVELANVPGEPESGQWLQFNSYGDARSYLPPEVAQGMAVGADDLNVGHLLATDATTVTLDSATPEQLAGAPVVRYELTIDTAKLAYTVADLVHRKVLQRMVDAGTRTEKMTVWLDDQDLPVQTKGRGSVTHYTKWGTPVSVSAPPPEAILASN